MGKSGNSHVLLFIIIFLFALGVFLFLGSLMKNSRFLPPTPSPVPQEIVTEKEGEIVQGFPEFPLYPDISVVKSYKKDYPDGTTGYLVVWETSASVINVMKWYVNELKNSGWTVNGPDTPDAVDEQTVNLNKNGQEVRLLVLENDEDGTLISVEFFAK